MKEEENSDFEHKYTRRCHGHNYRLPATYHLILKKDKGCCSFGEIAGDPRIAPGLPRSAYIKRSPLGKIIQKEVYDWPLHYHFLQIYQYCVMPDHVHILVRVKEETPFHFSFYVNQLKKNIKFRWNRKNRAASGESEDINGSGENFINMPPIFEDNYTDKIIFRDRSLNDIITYIRVNPHRLAMRKFHPEFFQTVRNIEIAGEKWQAYGNLFLLRHPIKSAVIVHRRYTAEERTALYEKWLHEAAERDILVSAFISPDEKAIRDKAEKLGGNIIHIQQDPFPEHFKPEKHRFDRCCEGKLLILAPIQPLQENSKRAIFLHLNRIAEALCKIKF